MAKLKDRAASDLIEGMKEAFSGDDMEVYECDKGDGEIVFVKEGEHLPTGWITKRGPKGVFHYCPNHKQYVAPTSNKHVATKGHEHVFLSGDNDNDDSE